MERSLSYLMTLIAQSPDRDVRKRASLAISDSWEAQRQELEEIFGLTMPVLEKLGE